MAVPLTGWSDIPGGYSAHYSVEGAPWWLRVWFRTPFIDRFAYPRLVARGHGILRATPGVAAHQLGFVGPGWRVDLATIPPPLADIRATIGSSLEGPEELDPDWGHVLELGLPRLPDTLQVGEAVAVARWVGPCYGAVRVFSRCIDEDGEDEVWDDAFLFRRIDGGWDEVSTGGAAGPSGDDPLGRKSSDTRTPYLSQSTSYGRSCVCFEGAAGADARWLEVEDADGLTRMPIESEAGHLIACGSGDTVTALTVRVIGQDGTVLLEEGFHAID